MKRMDIKSHCPINFTLEVVGDPWSLLILRDIAFFEKNTFKDFLESSERITTNILTNRLFMLEKNGTLTKKGHGLIPLLIAMVKWGTKHDPHSTGHAYKNSFQEFKKNQAC